MLRAVISKCSLDDLLRAFKQWGLAPVVDDRGRIVDTIKLWGLTPVVGDKGGIVDTIKL